MSGLSFETVQFYTTERAHVKNTSSLTFTPINIHQNFIPISSFWLENLSSLFQVHDLIPNTYADVNDRLNAMMCMILILSSILFICKFPLWWVFLIFGILSNIIIWKWESSSLISKIGNDYIVYDLYTPQSQIVPLD